MSDEEQPHVPPPPPDRNKSLEQGIALVTALIVSAEDLSGEERRQRIAELLVGSTAVLALLLTMLPEAERTIIEAASEELAGQLMQENAAIDAVMDALVRSTATRVVPSAAAAAHLFAKLHKAEA